LDCCCVGTLEIAAGPLYLKNSADRLPVAFKVTVQN